ncbi:hypothetical protein [Sandaracinus amylolyticus]|uniref:hypothetical protein n=1 Tax=Sandaracinus amylolyticus TaxID=927083 RepID=UPI001F43942D|nr:hypothetical protein [Sandaracinus amylolyticus]
MGGLRLLLGSIVGALVGASSLLGLWLVATLHRGLPLSGTAWVIATPGAQVVSWLTGWPLEQESGQLCYALGLPLTVFAAGFVGGGTVGALAGRTRAPYSSGRDPR